MDFARQPYEGTASPPKLPMPLQVERKNTPCQILLYFTADFLCMIQFKK
jgi:hypothetical protein